MEVRRVYMAGLCVEKGPIFKVILLGEAGVGKTAIFHRLKDGTFYPNRANTMGIDSCSKFVKVGDAQVTLSVWDTAGVERFRTLTNNYYRGAHVAILVYSVDDVDSLHSLTYWVRDADEYCPEATKVVLGNKCDLHPEICLDTEKDFVSGNNCERFVRVSAKTGQGVDVVFDAIAQMLVDAANLDQGQLATVCSDTFTIATPKLAKGQKKKWCCS